jgi:L-isoleucine 31-dioxygenase
MSTPVISNTVVSNAALSPTLSGMRVRKNFSYLETTAPEVNTEAIFDLITKGEHNGAVVYVIRGAFEPETGARVVENFDRILAETNGGNRHGDGYVKTHQIGATQFSRSGDEYVREVMKTAPATLQLFDGVSHHEIEQMFNTRLLEKLFAAKGAVFRTSRFKNIPGGFIAFRRWLDNGEMALMPHEDTAQLLSARADDYEIARASHVVSYNAAVEATQSGGQLVVWNLNPDDRCRENLGLVGTGYPYPPSALEGLESITLKMHLGDVYFINASFLHGVASLKEGRRLSAGRFIGQVADDLAVYWT